VSTPSRRSTDKELAKLYADFDRVTAELNAALAELKTQTLRADAAVGDANEAEQRLTAADERADLLEGLLQRVVHASVLSFESDAPEQLESLEVDICAALKPAGGGGDE
jgi:hypothetical protein